MNIKFMQGKKIKIVLAALILMGGLLIINYSILHASSPGTVSDSLSQITVNGVTASINEINSTETGTELTFCLDLPSNADWFPFAVLQDQSQIIQPSKITLLNIKNPETFEGTYRCFLATYRSGIKPTTKLVIQNIQTSMSENLTSNDCDMALKKIQLDHPDFSFTCNIGDHGIRFDYGNLPIGMTDQEAYGLVRAALTESVLGPWTFSLAQ